MTYTKQEWIDQQTVISAARMDHIEDGIEAAHGLADGLDGRLAANEGLTGDLDARLTAAEAGVAQLQSKTAVSYALNTLPVIPPGTGSASTVPTGWSVLGQEVPAITYTAADGFQINTPGVYTIALSGSYNGSGTGNMEYRVDHNGSRVLAVFGSNGDVSSRSGVCVITAEAGDLVAPNYAHGNSTNMNLRANSFNTISFVQIA